MRGFPPLSKLPYGNAKSEREREIKGDRFHIKFILYLIRIPLVENIFLVKIPNSKMIFIGKVET
ncbi:hypothetical protein CK510_05545 [Brunnivagina elsteri CCALA 953]|uniref:Uncharacterized protein n=1 Tax=Brunnivagina elsteri CCALA 953 TaxID=987040 RepID=A0A2A2TNN1_9CYAN|nr:hypothetical protein CK510_05545 [Calothrix elsteri CCALA 953]